MITIFTIPKSFTNPHIEIIQTNAIKSWLFLNPQPEIILYGDDEGVDTIANKLNIKHIPNIKKNEFGTPLLSDVFNNVEKIAKNDILCYVNCDIILLQDLIETTKIINEKEKKYLLLGQRWDYAQKDLIDFKLNWDKELKENVASKGGTTQQALKIFYKKGLEQIFFSAMTKAKLRAKELSRELE